jgi:uncharacterized cofD-like protein
MTRDEWRVETDAWILSSVPSEVPQQELRVVALGGGTGLPVVLQGLKTRLFPAGPNAGTIDASRLTGVVTVADDGGSSGRLRREHGVLPPGDIRNCLLALADGDPLMASLFDFRFDGQGETAGHSLGNLILTALAMMEGKLFDRAVEHGGRLLTIKGEVLPSTLEEVSLRAELMDGTMVDGESKIALERKPIRRVTLDPSGVHAVPRVLELIARADIVVIGPGSLYTSIIPNLLVQEIGDVISRSRARVALIANLMTERGETDGYTAADHLLAIKRHAPHVPVHNMLFNTAPVPGSLLEEYREGGANPVSLDLERVRAMGCRPVGRPMLLPGLKIRHDPLKLANALVELGRL